jgi:predicted Zn-dependent peptidase
VAFSLEAIVDPLYQTIKTVCPSGLTVLTTRTPVDGFCAGEIRINAGSMFAKELDPSWVGLPHFIEHTTLFGASKNSGSRQMDERMRSEFFVTRPNACTSPYQICYMNNQNSPVALPTELFWKCFEAVSDGIFNPVFSPLVLERERNRVLEEIKLVQTPNRREHQLNAQKEFDVEHVGLNSLGTAQQVRSFSQENCFQYHKQAFTLGNTVVSVAGDIDHEQTIDQIQNILHDVPAGNKTNCFPKPASVCDGGALFRKGGQRRRFLSLNIDFSAPPQDSPHHLAAILLAEKINWVLSKELMGKFGLYSAGAGYSGMTDFMPKFSYGFQTANIGKVRDVALYMLDTLFSPQTETLLANGHAASVNKNIVMATTELHHPSAFAGFTQAIHAVNGHFYSPQEVIDGYSKTSAEEVLEVFRSAKKGPMFVRTALRYPFFSSFGYKDLAACRKTLLAQKMG